MVSKHSLWQPWFVHVIPDGKLWLASKMKGDSKAEHEDKREGETKAVHYSFI